MKNIVVGIVAHVDAGKTSLSESILYVSGNIRKLGRVDNKDAYLDTDEIERDRGITVFSKQANIQLKDTSITLIDTPGHADFTAEMERSLSVLDMAILVISGADGVQGHTYTLWRLLQEYNIPVCIFVNKMDQVNADQKKVLLEIEQKFSDNCINFSAPDEEVYEHIALADEDVLEEYMSNSLICDETIAKLVSKRMIYPCFFGSALKLFGIEELLNGINRYSVKRYYPDKFGARVYKISRDEQGMRLTHLKVTGGVLQVKQLVKPWDEKINQIRIYSGLKYDTVNQLSAGHICCVTGLSKTIAGQGLGFEEQIISPVIEPVLRYRVIDSEDCSTSVMLERLRIIEEEEPSLNILWNEELKEIQIEMMGTVQIEILKNIMKRRFNTNIELDNGSILYKETIKNAVEGVGHFEPLRHYAEAHILLEPLPLGSKLEYASDCSEDVLDKNWQRLIMTHLKEKHHCGVLTGSDITDIRFTLVGGRAHNKHTEGGDFRQAVYRAVRQGLMKAESVLLEPYYSFVLEIPVGNLGRAIADIDRMNSTCEPPEIVGDRVVIKGSGPVAKLQNYNKEVSSYSKGMGTYICQNAGYRPCTNQEEIIRNINYDPLKDIENTPDSVFCSHGAGFIVSWDKVEEYMHVEGIKDNSNNDEYIKQENYVSEEELSQIFERTYKSKKKESNVRRDRKVYEYTSFRKPVYTEKKDEYLLVDGYNIIFAWDETKELAKLNLDSARGHLMDVLCNYQGYTGVNLIVVFDAYKVKGNKGETSEYNNINIVYTKEAETADMYIEKFTHDNKKNYNITVASSDGLEQLIIMGQGATRMSAMGLRQEIERVNAIIRDDMEE